MFKKILVANRGEIAVRIMKTCKEMGIKTVAVYSEADAESVHVKLADEAYLIGKSRVNESYLNIDKIIEVAKSCSADAIHPGYGLLSENSKFASRCLEEDIVFIGPSPDVIEKMGNKVLSRKVMKKAGIRIIPGTDDSIENIEQALKAANQLGYPIMLKASAGGGGVGINVIQNDEQLKRTFDQNIKMAKTFFGNGELYIEKYIENPRHIELQILADQYGNIVHLWERECSIQRRHQKIVEEAPSPFLDEYTREKMGEAAVKVAKTIGYTNAGTIEFLVDENKNFYFMEMNTRLQVEHPVTEEITGIDIVKEQIKIACGQKLSFTQENIKRQGHAIEVRIYAEDPYTFYPSPGTITSLKLPKGTNIRNDLAIEEQSVITPFYDPMIAKLIVSDETRVGAIEKLKTALNQYHIEGIKTNIPLLKEIVSHKKFQTGDTTINFLYENFNALKK